MKDTILLTLGMFVGICCFSNTENYSLNLQKNVLVYKNYSMDSTYLIQLIEKHDSMLFIRSCEVTSSLNTIGNLSFHVWDSIFSRLLIFKSLIPDFSSLIYDTVIQISDPLFFANNSIYSLKNESYYVKFNTFKLDEAYAVSDLYDIFLINTNKNKTLLKFWSSDWNRSFSFPIYIFQRDFWFILYSNNDSIQGSYLLHSVNGNLLDIDHKALSEMF